MFLCLKKKNMSMLFMLMKIGILRVIFGGTAIVNVVTGVRLKITAVCPWLAWTILSEISSQQEWFKFSTETHCFQIVRGVLLKDFKLNTSLLETLPPWSTLWAKFSFWKLVSYLILYWCFIPIFFVRLSRPRLGKNMKIKCKYFVTPFKCHTSLVWVGMKSRR